MIPSRDHWDRKPVRPSHEEVFPINGKQPTQCTLHNPCFLFPVIRFIILARKPPFFALLQTDFGQRQVFLIDGSEPKILSGARSPAHTTQVLHHPAVCYFGWCCCFHQDAVRDEGGNLLSILLPAPPPYICSAPCMRPAGRHLFLSTEYPQIREWRGGADGGVGVQRRVDGWAMFLVGVFKYQISLSWAR